MHYDVATAINKGKREYQEDAVATAFLKDHPLGFAVLADGMGGHAAGDIASNIVVTEVSRSLKARLQPHALKDEDIPVILREVATAANNSIASYVASNREVSGMGTTLIAPVLMENRLHWVSVGDSPLYVFSEGRLRQVNEDHSMAPQIDLMVRTGMLDEETARNHPDRNCLTSVLMGAPIPRMDCGKAPVPLRPGDIIIASSDGLQFLSDTEIQQVVERYKEESCAELAKALMAQVQSLEDPDQDNISLAVIKVS
ncbi:protein phosphatase 2C domain-containing protein [Defluviimonas sp. WL0002]|uniref:Protein phosphatase 2C domain-containing protein n=1 Tax=Albidovulum marisflavi TaxID=2984159 RepID=A0ABT2ZHI7_9RHOB|nr:protein phosphatase 2C domain-containing protein [Defluviimonas sp. WL0002]MCV2870600.1 protein phosphatase 2C domain-containing protein [Defluviimonas sp. WL0002]